MQKPSQQFDIDNRLLAIEALYRHRKYNEAKHELKSLSEESYEKNSHERGLLLALQADNLFNDGNYRLALETGLRGAKILANYPLNQRYARVLLVISKTYSAIGDLKNAERKAYDALGAYRRAGYEEGQSNALNELARIAFIHCDFITAIELMEEAVEKVAKDSRKIAQYKGNLGVIRTQLGDWVTAESNLKNALDYHKENNIYESTARNLLALGYLYICQRKFTEAEKSLNDALEIIEEYHLKRDKVIYLEYAGELALEKGDTFKAKSILTSSYTEGKMLAPESALVTQSGRRLAEVEFELDNHDEAMKYAQIALDLALKIGERAEAAMSRRVIAKIFAARGEKNDAFEYIQSAIETAREIGDPYHLGRILLTAADIRMELEFGEFSKIQMPLEEAARIFKKLKLPYWSAETDFRFGVQACQRGDLAKGFKKLSRSEKVFNSLGDSGKIRKVNQFLNSLADQAIALSVSQENELRVFGKLMNPDDLEDLHTGQFEEVLDILVRKTGADRAILITPDFDDSPLLASFKLNTRQGRKFIENFQQLLGEEISTDQPTLMLDCRRDPYINNLLPDLPEIVASIIVVPFIDSNHSLCHIYLEKISIDNMLNPFSQSELNFAVGFSDIIAFKAAELQKNKLQDDNRRLKEQLQKKSAFPNIITCNSQMIGMMSQVRQVVNSNISIGIEGETGSGKDLLARSIHYNSNRRDKRFISVNCAALPETLLESELFGYAKGAFTGADKDKPGLFEEADGGTFFLDEIGDMPLSVQAKILRVLESKMVMRLGDSVERKVDVRIISATNKDLKDLMSSGQFRADLYYRLSALTFRLPPLRERRDDIPLLVNLFLEDSGKKINSETMKLLVAYGWPGNIRELENEVKKLILLSGDDQEIKPEILSNKIAGSVNSQSENSNGSLDETIEFEDGYSLYDYLAQHEKRFIINALKNRKGVKKHAAASLHIPESTLRLKIKQYSIDLKNLDNIN